MSFPAHVLNVFIASPGDTSAYRDAVERALHRWNGVRSERAGVVLLPRRWEVDGVPLMGGDGQSQLNTQLVDKADIVIGIFHTRLGQPTPRSKSGTAEEIERTHAAGKPVHVYRSTAPLPVDVDTKKVEELRTFLAEMEKDGLTGSFATDEDLQSQVQAAIEHDLTSLSLGVAIAPSQGSPHAVLRAHFEPSSTTSYLRIANHGNATAMGVSFKLEPIGDGVVPNMWDETKPDLIPNSDYPYPLLTHSGTPNAVRVRMSWREEDAEDYYQEQTVSLLG
ncbi:DUF4062 domain-containing protein [Intrasporangium flavum]|uniref:DUF4062 domain-containing protein n=1 Tax=Intrasporangium flavum TaxID=1428657 RepID=UPI00096C0155|nr:DUF4062 domain-containing protein [Intrasporangium flavum]